MAEPRGQAPTEFGRLVERTKAPSEEELFVTDEQGNRTPFKEFVQLRLPETEDEAQRLATILKQPNARQEMGEDDFNRRLRSLREFRATNPKPVEEVLSEEPAEEPQPQQAPDEGSRFTDDTRAAIVETGLTFLTGAIAEPLAGLNAIRGLITGGVDQAVANLEATREAFTFQPRTAKSKTILQGIGSTIQKVDNAAAKGAALLSMGNPYAENAIYSTIATGSQAALEIGGLKAGSIVKQGPSLRETQRIARDLGIKVDETTLGSEVTEAARRMTPAERDANAPALRQALQEAQQAQRAEVVALREAAQRNTQTINSITDVAEFGQAATRALVDEGFDVTNMPVLRRTLEDLEGFVEQAPGSPLAREGVTPRSTPVANMRELDVISGRIEERLRNLKDDPEIPSSANERTALMSLDKKVNDFVDSQFNKDMITGNPEQIAAWKQFNQQRQNLRAFNEDRTISQLIQEGATPEQMNNWIFGASAAKPKPQVLSTINRLREVLGDDHTAIKGIQQDFLHRVAAPLFETNPNFDKFVRNYDTLVRERPSVVKAMGLELNKMKDLRAFADTAAKINPQNVNLFGTDFSRAVSQYFVGHGIAKASLRVRVASGALKLMFGKTRLQQRDILNAITEARLGTAAVDPGSVAAGRVIQASVLADIESAAERSKNNE